MIERCVVCHQVFPEMEGTKALPCRSTGYSACDCFILPLRQAFLPMKGAKTKPLAFPLVAFMSVPHGALSVVFLHGQEIKAGKGRRTTIFWYRQRWTKDGLRAKITKRHFSKWSRRFRFKRTTHTTGEGEKKQTLTDEAGSLFARSKSGVLSANSLPPD